LDPVLLEQTAPGRDGQTLAGEGVIVRFINLVKLPHTVFALPFALLGVVYASFHAQVTARVIVLVVMAFTAARFAAMGFNRIVDRDLDAQNPRTAGRELPTQRLSVFQAGAAVAAAAVIFVAAAWLLNPLCLALSPIALSWILAYSYTKRFTSWSHLWLGASLAIAPAGGYLAVVGGWSHPWWTLPVLALAVLTWVAGFDMFYALQDETFDREHGLYSAVVLLGNDRSILLAKALHGITIASLLLFGIGTGFGVGYYVGVGAAAAVLVWEHRLVRPGDLTKLDAAFFTMNGVMSIIVLIGAMIGRFI
jgi:4-hydroxybenzoate polyprenyltransferase